MNPLSDRELARRLLETREQGWTYRRFLRLNTRRYLLLFTIHTAVLALFAILGQWLPFYLILGMLIGTITREYGWVRSIKRTFPFSLKATDWDKVQAMADGKS